MSEDANKPKRKISWGRITGLGLLAMLLAALLAHAIWTIHQSHLLDAKIALIQSRHEPILPSDFAAPDVDPNNDAVTAVRNAAAAIKLDDATSRSFSDLELELPLTPQEKQTIESALAQSQASLDALVAAQGKPIHDWGIDATNASADQLVNVFLPDLKQFRMLARLLRASALIEHEQKNDRLAIQRISQIISVADVVDRYPALVGHLLAIGCRTIAADTGVQIAPDLNIGGGERDASIAEVRRTIGLLLDDTPSRDGYRRGFSGERMFELAMARSFCDGPPQQAGTPTVTAPNSNRSAITQYAIRPIVYRNADLMLDYTSAAVQLGDKPNWPAAQAGLPPPIPFSYLNAIARLFTPALDRAIEAHFRGLTDQHLAATSLALRWYAIDQGGKFPAKLDELVPAYLAAVPVDPMAANDHPILFRGEGDARIIYSVGTNGTDDGGSESPLPHPRRFSGKLDEWSMLDRVVHLTRQPRSDSSDHQESDRH